MAKQRRNYKSPPIVEALCEFRFAPVELDFGFVGRYYESLRKSYPDKPKARQEQIQQLTPAGIMVNPIAKVQFAAEEGRRLVVNGPNSLSIHDLKLYAGWDKFRSRIVEAYEIYQAEAKSPVIGISIRYLNAIELKDEQLDFRNYFTFLPPKLDGVPDQVINFLAQVQLGFPGEPYVAQVTFTRQMPPPSGSTGLVAILDINCAWQAQDEPLSDFKLANDSKVGRVIEDLRDRERDIFEGLITDRTRALFDE